MGKNIKRLSLALVALGLSAPVFADAGSPFAVTVPNQQGGFTIGADALWLRPSAPDLSYASVWTRTPVPGAPSGSFDDVVDIASVDPTHHCISFDLLAQYRIPCTGNDISLLWTHLGNASDDDSVSIGQPENDQHFIRPATDSFDVSHWSRFSDASSDVEFRYDAVDLDLGQSVNFGDCFKFRVFSGVRWADLKQTVDNTYIDKEEANTRNQTFDSRINNVDNETTFCGVGPQVGIDGRYCFGYGFGIDANTTISMLVGHSDASVEEQEREFDSSGNIEEQDFHHVDMDSKTRVVPAIDMNLGADYTYNFNNCSRSSVVLQAGYKVINYFDVAHIIHNNDGPNDATNIGFDGPYVGIKVNV